MWARSIVLGSVLQFALSCCLGQVAHAQNRIALKNGESAELGLVYWVINCRSIVTGTPQVEILEGPPEAALSIKEDMVVPRRQNCANPVPGGRLVLTANGITEPKEAQLIYRLKFKTKDGERQSSSTYRLSLFP